jgi:shikimate dehydrogenase
VLGPLLLARPASITVANRSLDKAIALVARHAALAALQETELLAHDLQGLTGNFDVVINATSSSLSGGGVPVPASTLKPGALAYDLMYGAAAQGYLSWADENGASARDGLGMLVEQAAEAFLIWRGVLPPSQQVLAELRAVMQ